MELCKKNNIKIDDTHIGKIKLNIRIMLITKVTKILKRLQKSIHKLGYR